MHKCSVPLKACIRGKDFEGRVAVKQVLYIGAQLRDRAVLRHHRSGKPTHLTCTRLHHALVLCCDHWTGGARTSPHEVPPVILNSCEVIGPPPLDAPFSTAMLHPRLAHSSCDPVLLVPWGLNVVVLWQGIAGSVQLLDLLTLPVALTESQNPAAELRILLIEVGQVFPPDLHFVRRFPRLSGAQHSVIL